MARMKASEYAGPFVASEAAATPEAVARWAGEDLDGFDAWLVEAAFRLDSGHWSRQDPPALKDQHPDWPYFLMVKAAADETHVSEDQVRSFFAELAEFAPPAPEIETPAPIGVRGTWILQSWSDNLPGMTGRIMYGTRAMAVALRFTDGELMSSYSGLYDVNGAVVTHHARAGFTSPRVRAVNPTAGTPGGNFKPRDRKVRLFTSPDHPKTRCLEIQPLGKPMTLLFTSSKTTTEDVIESP